MRRNIISRKRADQGFNVIQAVALAEFDGLNSANAYGRVPLKRKDNGVFDPIVPDLDGDYSTGIMWIRL